MPPAAPAVVDRLHERAFVAVYDAVQRRSEDAGMREIRGEAVAAAAGRVLEIGAGSGLNLSHYGPAVGQVLLLEPAAAMRRGLESAVAADGRGERFEVIDGSAEHLPVGDGSVDAVVGTFVLCSVDDPAAVLHEVARVLRPGGRYLGLEHVRSSGPLVARGQRAIAPAWRWAVRGCRCDQDAATLVAASPLTVESATPFRGPRQPWPVRPGLRIVARAPRDRVPSQ